LGQLTNLTFLTNTIKGVVYTVSFDGPVEGNESKSLFVFYKKKTKKGIIYRMREDVQ
jgi:hypothetical protein